MKTRKKSLTELLEASLPPAVKGQRSLTVRDRPAVSSGEVTSGSESVLLRAHLCFSLRGIRCSGLAATSSLRIFIQSTFRLAIIVALLWVSWCHRTRPERQRRVFRPHLCHSSPKNGTSESALDASFIHSQIIAWRLQPAPELTWQI